MKSNLRAELDGLFEFILARITALFALFVSLRSKLSIRDRCLRDFWFPRLDTFLVSRPQLLWIRKTFCFACSRFSMDVCKGFSHISITQRADCVCCTNHCNLDELTNANPLHSLLQAALIYREMQKLKTESLVCDCLSIFRFASQLAARPRGIGRYRWNWLRPWCAKRSIMIFILF